MVRLLYMVLFSGFTLLYSMDLDEQLRSPWALAYKRAYEKNKHRISKSSLLHYGESKFSQFNEDGIIGEIFKRLNISKGFFVEFGAGNGIFISNTRNLFQQGWSGCFIEPLGERSKQLFKNYEGEERALCLNYFITWHEEDTRGLTFDAVKNKHFPHQEIDFLSIDIDSGDFYVLKGLQCRPKVICVETSPCWHPMFTKEIPEEIAVHNTISQPLFPFIQVAKELGYRPVCINIPNLFLVRNDLSEPFSDISTDYMDLWLDGFRVKGEKSYLLKRRDQVPVYKEMEGKELNTKYPITEDL